MQEIGKQARRAGQELALVNSSLKAKAINAISKEITAACDLIISANQQDLAAATQAGRNAEFIDRLALNHERVTAMAAGVAAIANLDDPVGTVLAEWDRPNGLHLKRVRVPLGVIGVIYESRPNVTADAAALCLQAGNAVILRGGSESFHSATAIMQCIHQGLAAAGLPTTCVQIVPGTDRALVGEMLQLDEYIDVIIPRGGKSLIKRVSQESKIPVFKHLAGICHTYIHTCTQTQTIAPEVTAATESDWDTEYLDAIIAIKVIEDIAAAIAHINQHGSQHTDAIITANLGAAEQFLQAVDSAIVMHNTSTQFADGGEFGMGAEIGIATGKLHARGPVGVEQLTTFKYQVSSQGQTRA